MEKNLQNFVIKKKKKKSNYKNFHSISWNLERVEISISQ